MSRDNFIVSVDSKTTGRRKLEQTTYGDRNGLNKASTKWLLNICLRNYLLLINEIYVEIKWTPSDSLVRGVKADVVL